MTPIHCADCHLCKVPFMLSVSNKPECRFAECHYAECRYAECRRDIIDVCLT